MRSIVGCGQKLQRQFVLVCDQKKTGSFIPLYLPDFMSVNLLKCVADANQFRFGNVQRSKNMLLANIGREIYSPGFWIGCVLDSEELEIATI